MKFYRLLVLLLIGCLFALDSYAEDRFITVASTTSTENSGLFDFLLPEFSEKYSIGVRVVAVGTGQAIKNAQNGDADVLFVHHKPSETAFVDEGYGVQRFDVMYNDFILVGPRNDPANVSGQTDAVQTLAIIARTEAPFVSRGDDSGTHKKELALWRETGVDVAAASGSWYRETGSGMGATLNIGSGMNGYLLSDRATWLNFGNKGELEMLLEGDQRLFNQYGIVLVSPTLHPHVKAELGQAFVDWIVSAEGQRLIGEFRIYGQQAFFPNAAGS